MRQFGFFALLLFIPSGTYSVVPLFSAEKIRSFIQSSSTGGYNIHIRDMLGEGPGHFDPDPRYLPAEMNCTTWLQSAIVAGYAANEEEKPAIMDKLRYFYGIPGYSTRKHFTDNWLTLDPAPLRPVSYGNTPRNTKKTIPDYSLFKQNKNYTCPLWEEKNREITVDYLTPDYFLKFVKTLPPNLYVIFPVASVGYIQLFGKKAGPMGLVHGLILDVQEKNGQKTQTIHHASITRRAVISKDVEIYVTSKATKKFLGYTLWELDPDWDYKALPGPSADEWKQINELLECEKKL